MTNRRKMNKNGEEQPSSNKNRDADHVFENDNQDANTQKGIQSQQPNLANFQS